jgi:hypothetical protein
MQLAPHIGAEEDFGFVARFTSGNMETTYARLTEVLRLPKSFTLDFPALNVFFRLGMFLNGKTAFREIRRVNPKPVFVPTTALSRDAVIDAYIDLFRQSIRRRTPPHSALALSGGCDSRHILLEMHSQRHLPDYALTVAIDGRPSEPEIASELARRTGVKHIVSRLRPSTCVKDELYKNQACDFTTLEHGWFAGTAGERDSLPWWDGIAGDVLSAGLFLEDWSLRLFEEDRLDELADRLVSSHRVPFFRDQALFPRADAVSEVRAELEKHRPAANPVGSFYFWNRTRVTVAASAFGLMAPTGQVTLAPYLDWDLWRLLASLPGRMLLDHNLHRDTVMRAYPSFSDIPFFHTKVKIRPGIQRRKSFRLLAYLATASAPDPQQILMIIRAFRALVLPRHINDIGWLLPVSVYCTELQRLARQKRRVLV